MMRQSLQSIHDLKALAQYLRTHGDGALLPGYQDKMLQAAADIESQIAARMRSCLEPAVGPEGIEPNGFSCR